MGHTGRSHALLSGENCYPPQKLKGKLIYHALCCSSPCFLAKNLSGRIRPNSQKKAVKQLFPLRCGCLGTRSYASFAITSKKEKVRHVVGVCFANPSFYSPAATEQGHLLTSLRKPWTRLWCLKAFLPPPQGHARRCALEEAYCSQPEWEDVKSTLAGCKNWKQELPGSTEWK